MGCRWGLRVLRGLERSARGVGGGGGEASGGPRCGVIWGETVLISPKRASLSLTARAKCRREERDVRQAEWVTHTWKGAISHIARSLSASPASFTHLPGLVCRWRVDSCSSGYEWHGRGRWRGLPSRRWRLRRAGRGRRRDQQRDIDPRGARSFNFLRLPPLAPLLRDGPPDVFILDRSLASMSPSPPVFCPSALCRLVLVRPCSPCCVVVCAPFSALACLGMCVRSRVRTFSKCRRPGRRV